MRYILLVLLAVTPTLGLGSNESTTKNDLPPVARQKIRGVEVLVNQIQIQRLGSTAKVPGKLNLIVTHQDQLKRTIAISLSQRNQGTASGPTHLELNDGQTLHPIMHGNQRFMSVIANAAIPEGFDFAEYWFEVPGDTALKDIFPVTIVHQATNERQEKIEFRFDNIEP